EQAFLQDRVLSVPKRQRETEALFVIGKAGQTVFAPAVGARTGLVVAEVVPGVAAFAVVLADGPPLALAEVGSPLFPGEVSLASLLKSVMFRSHGFPQKDVRNGPV